MNIRDEERFHELAHKALANENQADEQAELQTLITEHPKLKEEFERIRAETAVAREILPMLENLKYPQKGIPRPPMRRLRKETREVFISYGAESKRELHDLIAALEAWIDRDRSEARARVEYLTGFAARWAATLERAPDQRLTTERARSSSFRGLSEWLKDATTFLAAELKSTPEPELESRLRDLERRIRDAEQITHRFGEDVRALLGAFGHQRQATSGTRVRASDSSLKED